jgi:hypothetical protein
MLLDGLEHYGLDVYVLFENIHKENLPEMFIVEQLIPLDDDYYSCLFNSGEGLYKLTVFDDYGKGLNITTVSDTLCSIFTIGTYVVDEAEGVALCIDKVHVNELLFEDDSDKVQKSVTVQYRKFLIK